LWSGQFADVAALGRGSWPRGAGAEDASTAETATMLNVTEPFGFIGSPTSKLIWNLEFATHSKFQILNS